MFARAIRKQQERLRESLRERVGLEADELVIAFEGPPFWIWIVLGAVVGILLFAVVGLGGAVGGALIGATIGSWFVIVDTYVLARTASGTALVEMEQPLLGTAKASEVVREDPVADEMIRREGRSISYADREFQLMPGWGDAADRLVGPGRPGERG